MSSITTGSLVITLLAVVLPTIAVFLVGRKRGRWIMLMAIVLAVAIYGQQRNRFERRLWHNFHYYLNSKYYDELGYDQLYNCATAALPNRWGSFYRDLSTYGYVYGAAQVPTCRADFSEARWQAFVADVEWIQGRETSYPEMWSFILLDKGYNGSPPYTAVVGWLANQAPLGSPLFWALIYSDAIFLVVGLLYLWKVKGTETAGLIALFTLAYFGNFTHLLANWFQYPWLTALYVGAAAWYAGRRWLSGFSLATATGLFVFPVTLLLWPALHWRQAGRRFWSGLAAGGLLWAAVGSISSRGLGAWVDFFRDMRLHSAWLPIEPRNFGLRNLVQMVGNPEASYWHLKFFSTGRGTPPNPNAAIPDWWLLPFVAGLLVLLVLVVRERPAFSLAAGLPVMFFALVISPYYWGPAAALIFLDEDRVASRRLLMAGVLLHGVAIFEQLLALILFQLVMLAFFLRHYVWPRKEVMLSVSTDAAVSLS